MINKLSEVQVVIGIPCEGWVGFHVKVGYAANKDPYDL